MAITEKDSKEGIEPISRRASQFNVSNLEKIVCFFLTKFDKVLKYPSGKLTGIYHILFRSINSSAVF